MGNKARTQKTFTISDKRILDILEQSEELANNPPSAISETDVTPIELFWLAVRAAEYRGLIPDPVTLLKQLAEVDYVIPPWCGMCLLDHADGMGGCWGISSGQQPKAGESYCMDCEFYRPLESVNG